MKEDSFRFLTRRDLARRWRFSTATIKRREKFGLPHFKINGSVRFALPDIEAIEAAARITITNGGSPR